MKCVKCGAELAEDSKFCNVCGEAVPQGGETPSLVLENDTETSAVSPVVSPVVEAPATVIVEPVADTSVFGPTPQDEAPAPDAVVPAMIDEVKENPVTESVVEEPITEAPTVSPVVEPITEAPTAAPVPEPVTEAPAVVTPTATETPVPAAPQNATPATPVAPTPKKGGVGVIIAIILLVAIAAGAGIFIGKNLLKGKNSNGKDDPSIENVSAKSKVTFADMEYSIPDDYEYYYDTLSQGIDCLIIEMPGGLELLIYDIGYSYFAFENSFDKVVTQSFPDAITTVKKNNKYAFVNYKIDDEGKTFYFYDGAVNTNSTHGLGAILVRTGANLTKNDLKSAMSIIETAKKSRSFERSQGESDNYNVIKNQIVISSYITETSDEVVPEE